MLLEGVRFSTLLADHIKYSVYTKADIAEQAGCSERTIKACVQQNKAPTPPIRKAFIDAIGFDPWEINRQVQMRTWRLNPKDSLVLNQVEAEYVSSVREATADYFIESPPYDSN